jgi:predicted DNA-binding transcriptional regulator AlpA
MKNMNDVTAARILNVAPQTLRNWRSSRKGPPYIKLGRSVRYREEDLAAWIQARRINPEGDDS